MDKREKGGFSPPALGGSSLLVIFAVLALTVFALLSLSTVQADVRLADASAQAVRDHYAADCKAQEVLARIRSGGPVPEGVEVQSQGGYAVLRYTVPISDTQELRVEIGQHADLSCEVLRWQAVPAGEWKPDDSLHLWDGEEIVD